MGQNVKTKSQQNSRKTFKLIKRKNNQQKIKDKKKYLLKVVSNSSEDIETAFQAKSRCSTMSKEINCNQNKNPRKRL